MSAVPPSASCNPSGTWGEPHDALWQRLGWQPSPQQLAQFEALQQELRRKEKALAEAAALLIASKKIQAYWGEDGED